MDQSNISGNHFYTGQLFSAVGVFVILPPQSFPSGINFRGNVKGLRESERNKKHNKTRRSLIPFT